MKTYTHTFAQAGSAWTCSFTVSLTATEMSWSPRIPPRSVRFWRKYRRWRDRCLQDFTDRTGVVHEITHDLPHVGLRLRKTYPTTRGAAYDFAKAHHAELSDASRCTENTPGVREALRSDFGAMMLEYAPDGAMQ